MASDNRADTARTGINFYLFEEIAMLYLVRMDVFPPKDMPVNEFAKIKAVEKEYSLSLQKDGIWKHIWRVVGAYSNYSIFDAGSNDELHDILQNLPLYPYSQFQIVPLATHPSDLSVQR
ncbi:MAG: muconolactone Delta-isomerase [Desulfovibrio sp.]|jgi:muconolactone D-isomerase|nr:muconolactone Delta-isomerase [Desulfovibrio sp.]